MKQNTKVSITSSNNGSPGKTFTCVTSLPSGNSLADNTLHGKSIQYIYMPSLKMQAPKIHSTHISDSQ